MFLFRVDDMIVSVMREQEEHMSMMDWSFLPPAKESSSWFCFNIAQMNGTFQRHKTFYGGSAINFDLHSGEIESWTFMAELFQIILFMLVRNSWYRMRERSPHVDNRFITACISLWMEVFGGPSIGIKELWWYMKI